MISFRESRIEDHEEIARCVSAVARERKYLATVEGFTSQETRKFLESLGYWAGVQIVALDGRKIVGWCDVLPLPFEGMRHVGRLGMGVLATHRRQGLGRRLLEETLPRARERGIWRIELDVFASNERAKRLYESKGFVVEGRKRLARALDGVEEDIFLMALLNR
ncbi:MAG TPA: GNAT family N-acetyltransferase [Vicinamibacteria bacterium]|nr:GNAT family N-acetyltransferase [Vicinamibacteria bacterium]